MNLVYENIENMLNLADNGEQHEQSRICVSPYANRINILCTEHRNLHVQPDEYWVFFQDGTERSKWEINTYSIEDVIKDPSIKYLIPVGVHEAPRVWAGYTGKYDSIFNLLNETYLKHLREGRAYILFDNTLEGYHSDRMFEFFNDECNRLKINHDNVILLTGNAQLEDRAEEWTKKTGKKCIRTIGYTHFEFDVYLNIDHYNSIGQNIPSFDDHVKYKTNNPHLIKAYNCLNRKPRDHRIVFFNKLFHAGLLPDGHVSMNPWSHERTHDSLNIDGWKPDVSQLEHSHQFTPMRWDGTDNWDNAQDKIARLNEKSMLNSWCTIVSEAQYNDSQGSVFLSEKTFKPIACSHPFQILGAKGSLKELKKLGYLTFGHLFDESYDELDNIERMELIVDNCRSLADNRDALQHFKWMKARVEYNRNVLTFNALFKPPKGFHLLNRLCNTQLEKVLL